MGKRQRVDVHVLAPVQGSAPPCVAYFPSGRVGAVDGSSIEVYAKQPRLSSTSAAAPHLVLARKTNIDYVGSTQAEANAGPPPCGFAVAVFDKQTGQLQLAPVAGGRVLRLEPRLHALTYEPSNNGARTKAETREQRLAANKQLVAEFGSTRRRRQLNAREEAIVKPEKLSGRDAVERIFADVASSAAAAGLTKDQVLQRAAEARNVPPHNASATTPEQAYPLTLLLSADGIRSLDVKRLLDASESSEKADALLAKHLVDEYTLSRLELLRNPDRAVAKRRAQYLALLAALVSLQPRRSLKVPQRSEDGSRSGLDDMARKCRMRPELLQELLDKFYVRSTEDGADKYERPDPKGTLLLLYLLAAALLAEGGIVSAPRFEALKTLLKLHHTKLLQHFAELGASYKATRVAQSALLDGGKAAADAGSASGSVSSYTVSLLRDPSNPSKTLAESFPKQKMGAKARR